MRLKLKDCVLNFFNGLCSFLLIYLNCDNHSITTDAVITKQKFWIQHSQAHF